MLIIKVCIMFFGDPVSVEAEIKWLRGARGALRSNLEEHHAEMDKMVAAVKRFADHCGRLERGLRG